MRDARKFAAMTQMQVGELLGTTKQRVAHQEAGRNPFRASEVGLLATVYRQSCDWLILGVRRNGATPDGARMLSIFDDLPDRAPMWSTAC